jgi:hypothetical protein
MVSRAVMFMIITVLTMAGCLSVSTTPAAIDGLQNGSAGELPTPEIESFQNTAESPIPQALRMGYLNPDGNHYRGGRGSFPSTEPYEIVLRFEPAWLVGVEIEGGSGWVVIADSGEVQAFTVIRGEIEAYPIGVERLPPGTQPSVYTDGKRLYLLNTMAPHGSPSSPPVFLPASRRLAFLDPEGDLILSDFSREERLPIGGLPDSRILVDEEERLLVLGGRTERYAHGALGDAVEASSIFVVQTSPTLSILSEIQLAENEVFEAVSPVWVDLDGDSLREILVTVSDQGQGSYLAIFSESGTLLARSAAIGRAFRWRHLLTAAEFSGEGLAEITAVLTPHIGGVLQYYAWNANRLILQAEQEDVSSHQIGSRNLDMALTGDFNGDLRLEILIPNTSYKVLRAYQRDSAGVQLVWEIPLGERLSTNLAGISFEDGGLGFGYGLENGVLHLWLPG